MDGALTRPAVATPTVPALLAARAGTEPDQVAMVVDSRALTFGAWDRRAGTVARALIDRGLRPGDRLALLFTEPEWTDYAVAYCAAQRAGAVAVPLSARLPPAAIRDRLDHCSAAGVVHGRGESAPAPGAAAWAAALADLEHDRGARPVEVPVEVEVGPDDLAQILYTSGTTGRPKAVAATHGNLAFGLEAHPRHRPLDHSRHFLHAFPIGGNAGQTMLLDALVARPAALVAPTFEADGFCRLIETYQVGTVFVVPAMAIDLLNSGAHRRHDLSSVLLLGSTGAAMPPAVALALQDAFPNATLANSYTSTEAAPAQTTMVFDASRPASVGRPDRGHQLRVAGPGGAPLAAGEVGEVWLRSSAGPRAYYGDGDGGAGVFAGGWVRMGDLGYLDGDGYLYLVDREDDLVQTGAFKVSTLQVEAALYEHPGVAEAAVVGVPHPVMGAMLAAAVVPRGPLEPDEVRAFLRERLPRHEVPARLELVEALPRSEAGKVLKERLRAALAAPREASGRPLGAPAEAELGELWRRVLGVLPGSAQDDFFALGGDSLRATQLASLASDSFGIPVPAALAFDTPVLARQAEWLAAARRGSAHAPASPEAEPTELPLSSQQESFLVWMHETDEVRDPGAVGVAIRIREELDVASLERGLRAVVDRHEALRTVFERRDGVYLATILPPGRRPPALGVETAASLEEAGELVRAARVAPFDIAAGPLLRAHVVHLGPEDHVLLLVGQHLVFDGWSMGVLLRELGLAYSALGAGEPPSLPPLPMRCSELCAWARAQWPRTLEFWDRTLDGAPAAFERFTGRAQVERFTRAPVGFPIDAATAGRLRAAARAGTATTFMVMTACWIALVAARSGSTDMVLMTPVPGRTRPEHEGLVGCLLQSLLFRVDAGGDPSFRELLARVRAATLAALDHQFYPYEEFRARFPFAAWVRYESWTGVPHFPGLESEPFELPRGIMGEGWAIPGGDLGIPELAVLEQPDGSLTCWIVYNDYAFERPAIEALAEAFLRCASRSLAAPDLRMSELTS
jgi:acyl-CoA synthetase (AMP-forming)/AMP-acid ligase II